MGQDQYEKADNGTAQEREDDPQRRGGIASSPRITQGDREAWEHIEQATGHTQAEHYEEPDGTEVDGRPRNNRLALHARSAFLASPRSIADRVVGTLVAVAAP